MNESFSESVSESINPNQCFNCNLNWFPIDSVSLFVWISESFVRDHDSFLESWIFWAWPWFLPLLISRSVFESVNLLVINMIHFSLVYWSIVLIFNLLVMIQIHFGHDDIHYPFVLWISVWSSESFANYWDLFISFSDLVRLLFKQIRFKIYVTKYFPAFECMQCVKMILFLNTEKEAY